MIISAINTLRCIKIKYKTNLDQHVLPSRLLTDKDDPIIKKNPRKCIKMKHQNKVKSHMKVQTI